MKHKTLVVLMFPIVLFIGVLLSPIIALFTCFEWMSDTLDKEDKDEV